MIADPSSYLGDPGRAPTDHPVAGLVGFYGWGNYGDELFLEAFRSYLEPTVRMEPLVGPDWVPRPALRRGVLNSDVVVIGAGDLLRPWVKNRYWKPVSLNRPVFIAGIGVPSWGGTSDAIVDELRRFFGHPNVRAIGVRDAGSGEWIREHLVPSVPVRVAPDLVCALDLPAVERPVDPPIFGVAVRQRETPDDLSEVRRLCQRALSLGYRLRRIVLATGRVRENDLVATASLGFEDAELISSDDLSVITKAIGECTVFATMKFHGVVVATMSGTIPIAMMPTTKTRNFLTDIGRTDLLSYFGHADLADHLQPDMAPIAPETPARLHAGAVAYLNDLRSDIAAVAADGYGRAGSARRR